MSAHLNKLLGDGEINDAVGDVISEILQQPGMEKAVISCIPTNFRLTLLKEREVDFDTPYDIAWGWLWHILTKED